MTGYATVSWSIDDILTLEPEWTEEQAEQFLRKYSRAIEDHMITMGLDTIETFIEEEKHRRSQ